MRRLQLAKSLSVALPLAITTLLWVLSKVLVPERTFAESSIPQLLSQITALWSIQLFAIALLISARSRMVERIFGGLDKSYHTHVVAARFGFILMILHVALLMPHYIGTGQEVAHLFTLTDFWPRNIGIASFYLFLAGALVGIPLWLFFDYQRWLWLHRWYGLAFVLAAVHAHTAHSDIAAFAPLRDWNAFWVLAGSFAWFYKAFFYRFGAQHYDYWVSEARVLGSGIVEIELTPKSRRIHFEPGEFAFISVRGNPLVPSEHHPFSFSSDPARRALRFSCREAGDYTRKLRLLKPGDHVEVYGPYGEFTSFNFDEYKRQVWIAGGIGVAPFLGMLSHERANEDRKEIWLIYDVKDANAGVYDAEIRRLLDGAEDRIHYMLRDSSTAGFLTGREVLDFVGDPSGCAFLLCGPPAMMRALTRQLVSLGVRRRDIHFESFDFM
jgi:predicted ferric reductase